MHEQSTVEEVNQCQSNLHQVHDWWTVISGFNFKYQQRQNPEE